MKKAMLLCLGGMSLFALIAAFPTQYGHVFGLSFVCFVPVIVSLGKIDKKWVRLFFSWLFFQLFFLVLFWYSPPQLPDGFFHMNPISAVWLLFLIPPILYGVALWCVLSIFRGVGGFLGCLCGTWLMVGVVEWLVFDQLLGFPLSLAITVYDHPPVLQFASLGGWMAVSSWLWLFNFLIAFWLVDTLGLGVPRVLVGEFKRHLVYFIAVVCLVGGYFWGFYRVNESTPERYVNAVLIQPNLSWDKLGFAGVSDSYFKANMATLTEMVRLANRLQGDMMLFPEAVFGRSLNQENMYEPMRALYARFEGPAIIVGNTIGAAGRNYNSALLVNHGSYTAMRHKKTVVPMIEDDLSVPDQSQHPFYDAIQDLDVGPMICFELMSQIPLELVRAGADLLTCHANTAYFGKSNWPFLHAAYLSLRAVELGRGSVLINNTGFSLAVDSYGRIVGRSGFDKQQVLLYRVPIFSEETLYSRYPLVFVVLLWMTGILSFFCVWMKFFKE